MILRTYTLLIKNSSTDSFRTPLDVLAAGLEEIPGFEGADFFRNLEVPDEYVFTERWSSLADHKAGTRQLPGTIFTSLMNMLSAPRKRPTSLPSLHSN